MPNVGKTWGNLNPCAVLESSKARLGELKPRQEPFEQCSSLIFTTKKLTPDPESTGTRMFIR